MSGCVARNGSDGESRRGTEPVRPPISALWDFAGDLTALFGLQSSTVVGVENDGAGVGSPDSGLRSVADRGPDAPHQYIQTLPHAVYWKSREKERY